MACARNTSTTRTYRISCLSTSHILRKSLGIYNGRTLVIASTCRAVCIAVVRKYVRKCLIHCQPAARSHSSDIVHQSLHTSQRSTCVSNVLSAIINRTIHILCPCSDIVSTNSLPFFYTSRQIYLSVEGKCRTPASISYAGSRITPIGIFMLCSCLLTSPAAISCFSCFATLMRPFVKVVAQF